MLMLRSVGIALLVGAVAAAGWDFPVNDPNKNLEGIELVKAGRLREGVEVLRGTLEENPSRGKFWETLGMALVMLAKDPGTDVGKEAYPLLVEAKACLEFAYRYDPLLSSGKSFLKQAARPPTPTPTPTPTPVWRLPARPKQWMLILTLSRRTT